MLASLEKSIGIAKGIWVSSSVISSRLYSQSHRYKNYTSQNSTESSSSSAGGGGDGGRMDRRRGRGSSGGGGRQSSMRNLSPLKVKNERANKTQSEKNYEMMKMNMMQYRKEFRQEIQEYGDPIDEPDPAMFSKSFNEHVEETQRMKDRIKTNRMTKKHYDSVPKEFGLLTWAERENIRYLHETDPDRWTPDAVAEAYPISSYGVSKVLKSSSRLRTINEVKRFDAKIAQRVKDIKSGAIPMTENMEKMLKVRELVPFRLGDLGINPNQYVDTSLPAKLGQFASLVAPPEKEVKKKAAAEMKPPVVNYMSDGDFYNPAAVNKTDETGAHLKPELSKKELKKIMPSSRLMTFSEFEQRMEAKQADKKAGDMKYMLELQKQTPTSSPQTLANDEIELPHEDRSNDARFSSNIEKYRKPEETGQVEVNVEGKQGYVYVPDTGYQKPYESSSQEYPEKISIPDEMWRPGATYQVGQCYYDENGDFLYRVF